MLRAPQVGLVRQPADYNHRLNRAPLYLRQPAESYSIQTIAPVVGLEPTTIALTGRRSTIELHRSNDFYFVITSPSNYAGCIAL